MSHIPLKTTILLICFFTSISAAQTTWYVDHDAPGHNTGLNWQDAFNDLQSAIDASTNGDQIHVAAGTYYPTRRAYPYTDNTETFYLAYDIQLHGGYAGYGMPNPDDRDFVAYETILSGDLLNNDGPDFTNYEDNADHVVTIDYSTSITGFTITAGDAGPAGWFVGGGILSRWSAPTIQDCYFTKNNARCGGAVRIEAGTISRCTFTNNQAETGGALRISQGAGATVTDCTFTNNHSLLQGGAVTLWEGQHNFIRCRFLNNHTDDTGGAVHNISSADSSFADCIFASNTANYGGAVGNQRGLLFTNTRFVGNSATTDSGAVFNRTLVGLGWAGFVNCEFTGNSALSTGAVSVGRGSDFVNCTLSGNSATDSAGAISCHYCLMGNSCGIVTMTNCIVWDNYDSYGDSFSSQLGFGSPMSDQTRIDYSCIQNWDSSVPGIGNIDQDPHLIDPDGWDNILGTTDDNLRLGAGSPCIDAGSNGVDAGWEDGHQTLPATDLDGLPRFVDDPCAPDLGIGEPPIVDMGSYEYQPDCNNNGIIDSCDIANETSLDDNQNYIPDECEIPGDCNTDGQVNVNDCQTFTDCLTGPRVPLEDLICQCADLNHDNHTDLTDFAIFQHWLGG